MYGCYRREDAADAETMLDAAAIVLAQYPDDVMEQVTHPAHGLPGRLKWPPSVPEIREACEALMARSAAQQKREEAEQQQLADRVAYERAIAAPPVDLKAKYGPNYGLGGGVDGEGAKQAAQLAADRKRAFGNANRKVFAKECEAAGVDPDKATVSPALAANITDYRRKMAAYDEASE